MCVGCGGFGWNVGWGCIVGLCCWGFLVWNEMESEKVKNRGMRNRFFLSFFNGVVLLFVVNDEVVSCGG